MDYTTSLRIFTAFKMASEAGIPGEGSAEIKNYDSDTTEEDWAAIGAAQLRVSYSWDGLILHNLNIHLHRFEMDKAAAQ